MQVLIWIKGNDALLVYDENEDGKIHNIDEAFGNATISGFDELRDTIDSNYDNKIDRRDILFNRLQLWHDYDQDGVVDKGELKSLKEEGITSIDLNCIKTTIANHFDAFVAKTIVTCKSFTTNKALHVKIENQHKGEYSGAKDKVA